MKKYILAGGECAGKSSTLAELKRRGFYVLGESNAELITREREIGSSIFPWTDFHEHNKRVIDLQLKKESAIPSDTSVVFLDRALTDTYGYYLVAGEQPPDVLLELIQRANYAGVFYFDMIPDALVKEYRAKNRRNSYGAAAQAHDIIKAAYKSMFSFPFIEVPFMSVDERVKFILTSIG